MSYQSRPSGKLENKSFKSQPNKSKITKGIVYISFVSKVNLLNYLCGNKLNQLNNTVSLHGSGNIKEFLQWSEI